MAARRRVEAGKQLQRHGAGAAGAGERGHAHRQAAVVDLEPALPNERLVLRQVFLGEDATVGANVGHDGLRHVAPVEGVRPVFADGGQHLGQVGLPEPHAVAHVAAGQHVVAGHEHAPQLWVHEQLASAASKGEEQVPVGREAVAGDARRGRHHLAQRKAAESPVRLAQPGDRTGHGDGQVTLEVGVVLDAGPAEIADVCLARQLVQIGLCRERAAHREADYTATTVDLVVEVTAPAYAAGHRLHHADREARGDRGVHGVAASLEHPHARLGREPVLGGNHALGGLGLFLA